MYGSEGIYPVQILRTRRPEIPCGPFMSFTTRTDKTEYNFGRPPGMFDFRFKHDKDERDSQAPSRPSIEHALLPTGYLIKSKSAGDLPSGKALLMGVSRRVLGNVAGDWVNPAGNNEACEGFPGANYRWGFLLVTADTHPPQWRTPPPQLREGWWEPPEPQWRTPFVPTRPTPQRSALVRELLMDHGEDMERDIQLVCTQTGARYHEGVQALRATNGDIVEAILMLTR